MNKGSGGVFEEELVGHGVASAIKFLNFKGYNLRPRTRVSLLLKSKTKLATPEEESSGDAIIKERYKELARVFHGSKPLKKKDSKPSKKPKLSFEVNNNSSKVNIDTKPKTRLFGFT